MDNTEIVKIRNIMVRFLPFFLKNFRCRQDSPATGWFGSGACDSWAVQSNLNIAGALAVLSQEPDLAGSPLSGEELLEYALKLFRYALRTHCTGGQHGPEGKSWGNTWISVLGLERTAHASGILQSAMTGEEQTMFRQLCWSEADFLLSEKYPVVAAIDAFTNRNKPESNIWNGSFLLRTALAFPEHHNAPAWRKKGTRLLLNGISIPEDRTSSETFSGIPLAAWHEGPNFTSNYSLDHHGYLNVGYMVICLSQLAYLEYLYRSKGLTAPPETLFHARELWNVLRNFIAPDGRLLRIGGDTRSRYTYCQVYLLPVLDFARNVLQDPEAEKLQQNYLALMESEQLDSPEGGFYSSRLERMHRESYFYYCRLESDPMAALSFLLSSARHPDFQVRQPVMSPRPERFEWSDSFHNAAVIRNQESFRSFVFRANKGMTALCLPTDRSDMAEWTGNMTGCVNFNVPAAELSVELNNFSGGFIADCRGVSMDQKPFGEGETPYPVLDIRFTAAALPDGRSMICREQAVLRREYAFGKGWEALRFLLPNDRFNGFKRSFRYGEKFMTISGDDGRSEIIETAAKTLVCDDRIAMTALSPHTFKIRRSGGQNVMLNCGLSSLHAETIILDHAPNSELLPAGSVLFDAAWAVTISDSPLKVLSGEMTPFALPVLEGADGALYELLWPSDGTPAKLMKNGSEVKK